jgi:hypothetical protein
MHDSNGTSEMLGMTTEALAPTTVVKKPPNALQVITHIAYTV